MTKSRFKMLMQVTMAVFLVIAMMSSTMLVPTKVSVAIGVIKKHEEQDTSGKGVIVTPSKDTAIKNNIIRGGVKVEKWDIESNARKAQGGATLEGAEFTIYNRSANVVMIDKKSVDIDDIVTKIVTNKDGIAETKADLLPYGTYEVKETKAPEGYLNEGKITQIFKITEHGKIVTLTGETAIKNLVIRGDLKGVKIGDGSHERLSNVPFKLTLKETGESHTILTDENGMFSTSSDWASHKSNTNRGETSMDGVWFGDINTINDERGALVYGTYIIEEQKCDSNAGKELIPPFEIVVRRNNLLIELGTLTNDDIVQPEIGTTATGMESEAQDAFVNKETTIVDEVSYENLKTGKEYTVKGKLMDQETGEELKIDGESVTAEKTFTAKQKNGTVSLTFTFDSSALAGSAVVAFEKMYYNDREVGAHEDLTDEDQTVEFEKPKIGTKAAFKDGQKSAETSKTIVIVDKVSYTNLIPDKEYTLSGKLMDQSTGKALLIAGKEVTAKKTFKPEKADGSVDIEFKLNAESLADKKVVVFEDLMYEGVKIATHADIKDEGQTVEFHKPGIKTTATFKDGSKNAAPVKEITIVDKVTYTGLIVGKEYTLSGVLMDKATGKALLIGGKELKATKTFTPKEANGSVDIEFVLNAEKLAGKELVVFEDLLKDGKTVTIHHDINDAGQTVRFTTPEPSAPKTPVSPKTPAPKTPATPDTGVNSNVFTYGAIALGLIGLLTAAVVIYKKRRNK